MDDIDLYLEEDLKDIGDVTSKLLFTIETGGAKIISKEPCVVAGLQEAKNVFKKTGAEAELLVKDGEYVKEKTTVAEIRGPIKSILTGERLALNFICKMSGIATETKKLIDVCKEINPDIKIAATRKTTPGFRKYEKKAVMLGGGEAHRFGLYDAIMIKDNHIKCVGSIEGAIKRVKQKNHNFIVEIEVENIKDATIAAKMGVDVVMLDNFKKEDAKIAAKKIREINNKILIEISGGINSENIAKYASLCDRISLGCLTHSAKSMDFSLEII